MDRSAAPGPDDAQAAGSGDPSQSRADQAAELGSDTGDGPDGARFAPWVDPLLREANGAAGRGQADVEPDAASFGAGASGLPPSPPSDGSTPSSVGEDAGEPGSSGSVQDGNGQVPVAAPAPPVSGLWGSGWNPPPDPVAAEPESAAPVPAQRPGQELDGATQRPTAGTAPEGPASHRSVSEANEREARDRLLAVLLDDPDRAVDAAVTLESCLRELERLSDVVRHERAGLRDVLHHLTTAGLRPEQVSRLARMPLAEVEAVLAAEPQAIDPRSTGAPAG